MCMCTCMRVYVYVYVDVYAYVYVCVYPLCLIGGTLGGRFDQRLDLIKLNLFIFKIYLHLLALIFFCRADSN